MRWEWTEKWSFFKNRTLPSFLRKWSFSCSFSSSILAVLSSSATTLMCHVIPSYHHHRDDTAILPPPLLTYYHHSHTFVTTHGTSTHWHNHHQQEWQMRLETQMRHLEPSGMFSFFFFILILLMIFFYCVLRQYQGKKKAQETLTTSLGPYAPIWSRHQLPTTSSAERKGEGGGRRRAEGRFEAAQRAQRRCILSFGP